MPLIEQSACKQKVHVIISLPVYKPPPPAPIISLSMNYIYYDVLKVNLKPVNAAKRISIGTTNYSVFQSLFSIPIISLLGYKPLGLQAFLKPLTKIFYPRAYKRP